LKAIKNKTVKSENDLRTAQFQAGIETSRHGDQA
jgi:hypothetical protein